MLHYARCLKQKYVILYNKKVKGFLLCKFLHLCHNPLVNYQADTRHIMWRRISLLLVAVKQLAGCCRSSRVSSHVPATSRCRKLLPVEGGSRCTERAATITPSLHCMMEAH